MNVPTHRTAPERWPPRTGVTGATGGLGSRVVKRLATTTKIAALARRPSRLAVGPTVEARRADYDEPASLARAFAGLEQLVFVASDGDPVDMQRHHAHVVEAIASSDIRRVVYLSAMGCGRGSPFAYAAVHRWTESVLGDLPVSLAVARASLYTDFLVPRLDDAARRGLLAVPMGDGRVAPVTRDDVAAALTALAFSDVDETVLLSGPELVSLADVCEIVGAVSGCEVALRAVTAAAYHEGLVRSGHALWVADAYASLFASIADGWFADWSDDIRRLTGQQPTTMAAWLAAHWSDTEH